MPRPLSSTRQPPSASKRDVDAGAVPRHRFVDGVVDNLTDEVMQAGEARRPDVHTGPFADRFEALEDLNLVCVVARLGILFLRVLVSI